MAASYKELIQKLSDTQNERDRLDVRKKDLEAQQSQIARDLIMVTSALEDCVALEGLAVDEINTVWRSRNPDHLQPVYEAQGEESASYIGSERFGENQSDEDQPVRKRARKTKKKPRSRRSGTLDDTNVSNSAPLAGPGPDQDGYSEYDRHELFSAIVSTGRGWVEIRCPACLGNSAKDGNFIKGLGGLRLHIARAHGEHKHLGLQRLSNESLLRKATFREIVDVDELQEVSDVSDIDDDDPAFIKHRLVDSGVMNKGVRISIRDLPGEQPPMNPQPSLNRRASSSPSQHADQQSGTRPFSSCSSTLASRQASGSSISPVTKVSDTSEDDKQYIVIDSSPDPCDTDGHAVSRSVAPEASKIVALKIGGPTDASLSDPVVEFQVINHGTSHIQRSL